MILRKGIFAFVCLLINLNLFNFSWAEPLIVLEFNSQNQFSSGDGKNAFSIDPNHFENYVVKSGDSLNLILKKFYKGSGLDWRFVQLSIVLANPKSFAKSNPNFLFSNTQLYLPGKTDIAKLLEGKKIGNPSANDNEPSRVQSIYFFGG